MSATRIASGLQSQRATSRPTRSTGAQNEEPRSEGESDDDVEAHKSGPRSSHGICQRTEAPLRASGPLCCSGPQDHVELGQQAKARVAPSSGSGSNRRQRGRAPRAPPSPSSASCARRALNKSSSPIAAWFAKRPSSSISASVNRTSSDGRGPRDAQRFVLVEQRHGHQALGDVAGGLCGLPPEPRVALDVLDDEGLARREHPAGDSRSRGKAPTDQLIGAVAGHGFEDESPAASSSRKIEDALAEKIARAVSTIDWRSDRCSPSPVRTPAATAARNRSSLTSRRPRCSR